LQLFQPPRFVLLRLLLDTVSTSSHSQAIWQGAGFCALPASQRGPHLPARKMSFFMEFLRHKIAENMQSNEEIDKFWHDRINKNKEVAKRW